MIIFDTNVWISFFKGEKKALWIKDMIIENQSILHPYIYGELLLGGIADKAEIMLQALEMTTLLDQNLIYRFIKKNKLNNKGVGWVDVNILMSALLEKHQVYTYDENLIKLCRDYNCNFN
jgi:hypothetical protein